MLNTSTVLGTIRVPGPLSTLVFGVCTLLASGAYARPYPGFTGLVATADSAATAANNPAGITRFSKRAFEVEGVLFSSDSEWESEFSEIGIETSSKDSGNTFVPRLYYVEPLTEDLSFSFTILGAGFSDDLGDWPGRYFIQEYSSLYVNAFPSLAWQINDRWSVAGSAILSYTSFEQERAVSNLFDPGVGDGVSELEADSLEFGFGASTLYQFSDRTRVGLTYMSAIEPDRDADVSFKGLGPNTEAVFERAGIFDADLTLEAVSPASVTLGGYHEFENGHALTLDFAWINFSDFSLTEYYFNGESLIDSGSAIQYDDIYAMAVSYSFPIAPRWSLGVGGFITNEMLDDDERSITFRLDALWSFGVSAEWQWTETRDVEFGITYIGQGDAPVTTGEIAGLGSLQGEYTSRDAWLFQISMRWGGRPG